MLYSWQLFRCAHTPLSGHLFKSYADFLIHTFFWDTSFQTYLLLLLREVLLEIKGGSIL